MSDDLNDSIQQKMSEETERAKWGIDLYHVRDDLPSIDIPFDDYADYMVIFREFLHIANEYGKDVSYLFAQLCQAYEIEDTDDLQDPQKFSIRLQCIYLLNMIAHALKQGERILDIIEQSEEEKLELLKIPGSFYYFIPILCQNLFCSYAILVNFVSRKQYLSNDFIEEARIRLNFMVSPDFEEFRKRFNVVECYNIANNAQDVKLTVH